MATKMEDFMKNPGLEHLVSNIMKRLSPKDLGNCRLLSKVWRDYIDDPVRKELWYKPQFNVIYRAYVKASKERCPDSRPGDPQLYFDNLEDWMQVIRDVYNSGDITKMKIFTKNMLRLVLDKYGDGDVRSNTPLHRAVRDNNLDFLKMLPYDVIDLSQTDYQDETAFFEACYCGKKEIVEFLVNEAEYGAKWLNMCPFVYKGTDVSPFEVACRNGDVDIVELLLKNSDKGIGVSSDRSNGLFEACQPTNGDDHGKVLEIFLKCAEWKKIDIFKRNDKRRRIWIRGCHSDGWTPFETACEFGMTSIVSVFLNYFEEKGIKITDHGMMPLICASKRTEEYHDYWIEWQTWHEASYEERTEVAKILIDYYKDKVDLFVTDDVGMNPLHHACASGSLDIVRYLLKSFPDINVNEQDSNGRTPLHHASAGSGLDYQEDEEEEGPAGYLDVVEFLLSKKNELGVDPEVKDNAGRTALNAVKKTRQETDNSGQPRFRCDKKELISMFQKYGFTDTDPDEPNSEPDSDQEEEEEEDSEEEDSEEDSEKEDSDLDTDADTDSNIDTE